MKKVVFSTLLFLCFFSYKTIYSQCTNTHAAGTNSTTEGSYGQSFEPTCSGTLNTIGVVTLSAESSLTVTLYGGEGTGGPVLATLTGQSIPMSASVTDFRTFDFSAEGVSLTAGNRYTFIVTGDNHQFIFDNSATYSNGQLYFGGSAQATLDLNFEVDLTVAAASPADTPSVSHGPPTICDGNSALLTWSGSLNDNAQWRVYSGSCGGTLVGTTTGSSLIVTPPTGSTTYFVRGEGGAASVGSCGTRTITTTARENANFNYSSASYSTTDADPTPTITGVSGGSFSVSPAGLAINSSSGIIDVSASTPSSYTVTYTTPGLCSGTENRSVTIANNAPTDILLSNNSINLTTTGTNATVGTLSTTDADTGDSHTYSLVSGTGSTNNSSFNISGNTLRTNSTLASGNYSIRINTNDGTNNFAKIFSIAVVDDRAVLSIAAITQAAEDATNGQFRVSTSSQFPTATQVNFSVSGTATAGTDYTSLGTSFIFPANTNSLNISVPIIGDNVVEADETVIVTLLSTNNSAVIVGTVDDATVTITDNDTATVTIADNGGNEDDGSITFTATLNNAVDGGFDVDVSTADGTATIADSDYTAIVNQTLSFAGTAGETETFTITPTADTKAEPDETVNISMSGLSPSTVSTGDIDITDGAIATINNDDSISIAVNDSTVTEGNSGGTTLQFTVSLSAPAPIGGATVDYVTSNGTATAGSDYTAIATSTLSFLAGETSKTVDVTVAGDNTVETNETLTLTLSNPTGTSVIIADATGTGAINNDDTTTVTVADVDVNENSGTATLTFTLSNAVDGGLDVDVSTADGTASTADGDYAAVTSQTITFAGTASEQETVVVTLGGDTKVEADETVSISMSNLVPVTVPVGTIDITGSATLTLENDDTATVTIADNGGNEDDGSITFTATLNNAVDGGFDVDVSTADGTATIADSDYTAIVNQMLSFAGTAGETETLTITPTADTKAEPDETVNISMSGLSPSTVSTGDIDITDGAIATINNDDSISIAVNDPTVTEGNSGGTILQFTVSLSAPAPTGGATVDYTTSNGTATAGSDYTAIAASTLSFLAGETSKTVDITVAGDNTVENNETLTLTLSNPTGTSVIIADATGTGTINNDDTTVVTIRDIDARENAGVQAVMATLSNPVQGGFALEVFTTDGTATVADSDYSSTAGSTLNFVGTVGETQSLNLSGLGDTKVEADENFIISMRNVGFTSVNTANINISDTAIYTILNDDTATVTIADNGGNEDDGSITFIATLNNAVDGGFDVDVSTADGTATIADSDYTAIVNQTLSFAGTAGETETFTITPTADTKAEPDETVNISMSGLSPSTVSTGDIDITDGAIATINNDDSISIAVNDPPVTEGNSGGTILQFTVSLSAPAPIGGATVDYVTSNGTATAGSDYTAIATSTLSFLAGETSKTVDVAVAGDNTVETNETLTLTLSNPTGTSVIIADATGTGTINNDDTTVVTIRDIDARENAGVQAVMATLSNPVQGGFALEVFTTDGTATVADSDYSSTAGSTLNFVGTVGETQSLNLSGLGDTKVEADENFIISMRNVGFTSVNTANINISDTAIYTILNDDTSTVTIAGNGGNEDDGSIAFIATLNNAVDGGFTVDVSTADGTATVADSDYIAVVNQTLTFTGNAGETQNFTITPNADTKAEPDETVNINMSNVVPGTVLIGDIDITDGAIATINNDDSAAVTIAGFSVDEMDGTATVSAILDNAVQGGFIVDINTSSGSATSGVDYGALTGNTLTFAGNSGEVQSFSINITDDNEVENTENFQVSQSNLAGTTLSITITDTAQININDNDSATVTNITSDTTDGTYSVGENINIFVDYTDAVTVTGTPQLTLETGTVDRTANYANSLSSTRLRFVYNVQAGDRSTDLDLLSTNALSLNGGTINDRIGGNASLIVPIGSSVGSLSANKNLDIDGTVPTVTTSDAINTQQFSSTLGGIVTNQGGTTVTERGIVYAVTTDNSNPEIGGANVVKVQIGDGTGIFNSTISGLSANTDYSYNSYAINGSGTSYGTVKNFSTLALIAPTITFDNISKTYGEADFSLSATSNSTGNITYSIIGANEGTTLSGSNNQTVNIGNASAITIRATQVANGIYTGGTSDITLTINKADLMVTAKDKTKVYGDSNPVLEIDYAGFVNGDTEAVLDTQPTASTTATVTSPVGTYNIALSEEMDNNYNLLEVLGSLTITKATLTVTADDMSKVYGEVNPSFTINYRGFVNTDTDSDLDTKPTASSAATILSPVGVYNIVVSDETDNNYNIVTVAGNLTVTKATLTVTANDKTKSYGANNPTLDISYTGFVNGDTELNLDTLPLASTTATAASPVGTYSIVVSDEIDNNYDLVTVAGDLVVTKAILTVTAKDKTKVYGDSNPVLDIDYAGFVNGDTVADLDTQPSVSTTTTITSPVGTYNIMLSEEIDDNYNLVEISGSLDVTKATLTATADDKSKIFGEANPSFTITYRGFVNADTESDLDSTPIASTTATTNTGVGNEVITISDETDNNYEIVGISGTLEILPKNINVIANDITVSFQDSEYVFSDGDYTATGLVPGELLDGELEREEGFIAGNYQINQGTLNSNNYTINFTNGTFTILEKERQYGFSPSGDGINDTWQIMEIKGSIANSVEVYNRSGNLVYKKKNYDNNINPWSGVSNQISSSGRLPVGPYRYKITVELPSGTRTIEGWLYINY
ncbi:Calx-beta domain-containing protein [Wenyingzhuangia sp. IMCC45533]